MAPEQAAGGGGPIGSAVDVYALGAILYEVLTGRPPFHGETPLDTLEQVRRQEPLAPSRLRLRLPRDLETICLKCLEKEPGKRYPSAGDLAGDLRRFLAGEPIRARPVTTWNRTVKWAKRRPAAAVLLILCVLLATVGFPGVTWLWLEKIAALKCKEKEHQRAEAGAAATLIALAHRDWLANDLDVARRHLDECPPEYRNERWHYLYRACHAEILNFSGLSGPANFIEALAWSPDNKRLALPGRDNSITLRDAASGQVLLTLTGHRDYVNHLVFSPTGEHLLSGARERLAPLMARQRRTTEIKRWDAVSGKELASSSVIDLPGEVALLPDGRLAVRISKEVKILDAFNSRELLRLTLDSLGQGVAFSPDNRYVVSTEHGGAVRVWNTDSGKPLQVHREPCKSIGKPAFGPDGLKVAWAITQQENVHYVKIWEWNARQELLTLVGHTARVNVLAFHRSGRFVASAGDDRTVMIWDTITGREALTLRGHTGSVLRLAFSPDGERLASADADGAVKVWETSLLSAGR
jgi:hypothetical protein